jgi:uncharacterized membrane protein
MSKLVVAFFKNDAYADKALQALLRWNLPNEILDLCAVRRTEDGAISLQQGRDRISRYLSTGFMCGGIMGMFTGLVLGYIKIGLLCGLAAGGLLGALWSIMHDYGIENGLVERLGTCLKPKTSALFLMFRGDIPKPVLQQLRQWHAALVYAPATAKIEEALRQKLIILQQDVAAETPLAYVMDFQSNAAETTHARQ